MFTWEFRAINRFASSSVSLCKVPSVKDKLRNDAMEGATFITEAMYPGWKFPKILRCLRHYIIIKLEYNATCRVIVDINIELSKSNSDELIAKSSDLKRAHEDVRHGEVRVDSTAEWVNGEIERRKEERKTIYMYNLPVGFGKGREMSPCSPWLRYCGHWRALGILFENRGPVSHMTCGSPACIVIWTPMALLNQMGSPEAFTIRSQNETIGDRMWMQIRCEHYGPPQLEIVLQRAPRIKRACGDLLSTERRQLIPRSETFRTFLRW